MTLKHVMGYHLLYDFKYCMTSKPNDYLSLRCTTEQKEQIQAAADKENINRSEFCLRALMEKVKKPDTVESEEFTQFLKEQVKEKDERIRNLEKLLDQEQQLHAMSRSDNQEQKLLINKLNRPFWQKWFGRE